MKRTYGPILGVSTILFPKPMLSLCTPGIPLLCIQHSPSYGNLVFFFKTSLTLGNFCNKKFLLEDYSCVMCNDTIAESRTHLMFHWPFAKACLQYIFLALNILDEDSHLDCISKIKSAIDRPFFMEIIILCAWFVWLTRNSCFFSNIHPSLYRCRAILKSELKWLNSELPERPMLPMPPG
jgi:hypothetical protein